MRKIFYILVTLTGLCVAAGAQTKSFKLGKWTEIHSAILKELNRSYVDSLPVDRIERAAVDGMLANLDPYTVYIPAEEDENLQMLISKKYGGIGAVIFKPDKNGNVIINEPYEGAPAQKYGLQCGDEIMAIDGVSVEGLTSAQASDRMRGVPGTRVVFKVKKVRTGQVKDIKLVRETIHIPDISWYGMLDDKHGYIGLTGFTEGVSAQIRKAVLDLRDNKGMKTLVLDLRGNGGGLLQEAVDIVSLFVPKGSLVVTAKGREQGASYTCRTTSAPIDLDMPIIVMVDSASASASEIVSGALQDLDRATIKGTRTYGKGLVQSIRPLPYGGKMKVTTAKYYTPSGRCVQAIDYSHRAEDGSVGHIPDSLTHEFKTAGGRIVRDGGGITPDVEIKGPEYSRITYALVAYGIVEQFALDFVRRHESICKPDDFHLDDSEFEKFVEYAATQKFDYRSSAKAFYDRMKEELEQDGLSEGVEKELEALGKAMDIEKKDFIRLKKTEIVPFIEEEIVIRYYFQKEGARFRLRYDDQLREALK